MSTIYETTQASQEQFIDAVRQSQQAVLDAVAAWTKAVEEIAPPLPTVAGLENLPKPEVVIDNAYDFAQKLLDTQREFARNFIQAASPALENEDAIAGLGKSAGGDRATEPGTDDDGVEAVGHAFVDVVAAVDVLGFGANGSGSLGTT